MNYLVGRRKKPQTVTSTCLWKVNYLNICNGSTFSILTNSHPPFEESYKEKIQISTFGLHHKNYFNIKQHESNPNNIWTLLDITPLSTYLLHYPPHPPSRLRFHLRLSIIHEILQFECRYMVEKSNVLVLYLKPTLSTITYLLQLLWLPYICFCCWHSSNTLQCWHPIYWGIC